MRTTRIILCGLAVMAREVLGHVAAADALRFGYAADAGVLGQVPGQRQGRHWADRADKIGDPGQEELSLGVLWVRHSCLAHMGGLPHKTNKTTSPGICVNRPGGNALPPGW